MNNETARQSQCQSDWLYLVMTTQPILLLVFGFGANLCSFIVLIQPRLSRRPTFSYLAFLSLSNAFLSLIHAFFTILGVYFRISLENLPLFLGCRLLNRFLIDFLTHFSLCTLAAVDLDRVRTVTSKTNTRRRYSQYYPRTQSRCTPAFLQVCLVESIFAVILIVLHLHWLTSYGFTDTDMNSNESFTVCSTPNPNRSSWLYVRYLTSILPIMEFICSGVVPFMISLIATIIILRHISLKYSLSANQTLKQSRRRIELHLSILLISLNCVFLVFTTPHNVYNIYLGQYMKKLEVHPSSEEHLCSVATSQKSLDLLQQCYIMSTFFLYILTNSRFRAEFYRLLQCSLFSNCRSTPASRENRMRKVSQRLNNGENLQASNSFVEISDESPDDDQVDENIQRGTSL